MIIAERLKELRAEKGLALKQLEAAVGIGNSTLHRWESGQNSQLETICENLIKLANFYDVTIDYLLGIEN